MVYSLRMAEPEKNSERELPPGCRVELREIGGVMRRVTICPAGVAEGTWSADYFASAARRMRHAKALTPEEAAASHALGDLHGVSEAIRKPKARRRRPALSEAAARGIVMADVLMTFPQSFGLTAWIEEGDWNGEI
jgi:hypothetical protein